MRARDDWQPANTAMNAGKGPDIFGLSGRFPGGGWPPPLLFGCAQHGRCLAGVSPVERRPS